MVLSVPREGHWARRLALIKKYFRLVAAQKTERGEVIHAGARYFFAVFSLLFGATSLRADEGNERPYRLFHPDIAPWGDSRTHEGFIVSTVETAFRRARIPYEVVYAPWKREQATVQQGTAFMAPLTRLESRENLYQWIAPVNISYLELVSRNPALATLAIEELLDQPIATRMESPAEFTARQLGFRSITLVEDEEVAARLLNAGRVALWMQRGLPGDWAYRHTGGNPAELYRVKRWHTPVQYLVASPSMPADVVNRLRSTLNDMRTSGEIDRIKQSFFKEKLDCDLLLTCGPDAEARFVPHP